jgi:hypothetical protein
MTRRLIQYKKTKLCVGVGILVGTLNDGTESGLGDSYYNQHHQEPAKAPDSDQGPPSIESNQ